MAQERKEGQTAPSFYSLFHSSWSDLQTRHWKATEMSGTLDSIAQENQMGGSVAQVGEWGTSKGLGSIKQLNQDPRIDALKELEMHTVLTDSGFRSALGAGLLTLSTCSRFSSLSWSWFFSHRAKSLSCVTAPRVSLSLAYSDFTCADRTSKSKVFQSEAVSFGSNQTVFFTVGLKSLRTLVKILIFCNYFKFSTIFSLQMIITSISFVLPSTLLKACTHPGREEGP